MCILCSFRYTPIWKRFYLILRTQSSWPCVLCIRVINFYIAGVWSILRRKYCKKIIIKNYNFHRQLFVISRAMCFVCNRRYDGVGGGAVPIPPYVYCKFNFFFKLYRVFHEDITIIARYLALSVNFFCIFLNIYYQVSNSSNGYTLPLLFLEIKRLPRHLWFFNNDLNVLKFRK